MSQNSHPSPESSQDPERHAAAAERQPGRPDARAEAKSRNQAEPIDLSEYIPSVSRAEDTAELRFEPLTESNAAAVNDLFQGVFGVERPLEHHRWKFFGNPEGPGIACVAIERSSGSVVGVNAGLNWRFWTAGREVRFLQTCETAIAPRFRGLRLYRQITGDLAWQAVDRGMVLAYGGRINPAALRLGERYFSFRQLFELATWERRLSLRLALGNRIGRSGALTARAIGLIRRPKPAPEEDRYQFKRVDTFDSTFDQLWERYRDGYAVIRVRDAAALNHRYRDCPVGEHRVWLALLNGEARGYVVTRLWEHGGARLATVLDWLDGGDPELLMGLYSRALRDAAMSGCDFFRVAPVPGSSAHTAVSALAGFVPSTREPVDRVVTCLLPLDDPRAPEHAFLVPTLDPSAWHYTQGDSDFHD